MRQRIAIATLLLMSAVFRGGPCFGQQGDPTEPSSPSNVETSQLRELSFFAGVRLWMNEFNIPVVQRTLVVPNPGDPSSAVFQDSITEVDSNYAYAPIPVIGVRWKKFLASAAYLVNTTYKADEFPGLSVKRQEIDLNVGYFVLPSLIVSVGYKGATLKGLPVGPDSTYDADINGVLLGLSGSAPLSERLSLYGNFAYGIAREKVDGFVDAAGEDSYDGNYTIGEVGLSYRFLSGRGGAFVKSLIASLGYRFQTFQLNDVALGTYNPTTPTVPMSTTTTSPRTTSAGFILGLVAVF